MATCRNSSCSNWVLSDGDECYLCSRPFIVKPIEFKPIEPAFYCSKSGCFNRVSTFGGVCSSCSSPSFDYKPSYIPLPSYSGYDNDDDDDDDVDKLFERAKSAYRREQRREQDRIRRNKDYAYDWVQSVIGFLTAILNFFSSVWAACCFISTAVMRHFGLPADCHYLQVLRRFRDNYVLKSHNTERIADIRRYYAIAPAVVAWVEGQSNADTIWKELANVIADCVARIECGDEEGAYALYKTKVLSFEQRVHQVEES